MTPTARPGPARMWAGRILSGLVVLFLALDGGAKVAEVAEVLEQTEKLGVPRGAVRGVGILLLACTAVYAVPRTAVLGAVLLTGYLGGAVAIHVRAGGEAFPVLFPLVFGCLAWGGLFLREPGLLSRLAWRG